MFVCSFFFFNFHHVISSKSVFKLVAALTLCAYFLNEWPTRVLHKHQAVGSYIWRPTLRQGPALYLRLDGRAISVERYLLAFMKARGWCFLFSLKQHWNQRAQAAGLRRTGAHFHWLLLLQRVAWVKEAVLCEWVWETHSHNFERTFVRPKLTWQTFHLWCGKWLCITLLSIYFTVFQQYLN